MLHLRMVAGKLYVADSNNHAIRVIDLAGGSVEMLMCGCEHICSRSLCRGL